LRVGIVAQQRLGFPVLPQGAGQIEQAKTRLFGVELRNSRLGNLHRRGTQLGNDLRHVVRNIGGGFRNRAAHGVDRAQPR
jgi:hypothetical protein